MVNNMSNNVCNTNVCNTNTNCIVGSVWSICTNGGVLVNDTMCEFGKLFDRFYSSKNERLFFMVVRQEEDGTALAYYVDADAEFVGMTHFSLNQFYPLTKADKELIETDYYYLKNWDLANLPDWARAC